ncbi:MAG: plasmid mobilization relaxosome protein MobC [Dehalococcoidia bacterium]|nr:plasmid mobilization relaxosome protein MobC [Dehalococcoidia bacterium]
MDTTKNEVISSGKKKKSYRLRNVPILLMVSQSEHDRIQERMAEVGSINMSAFIRKIVLTGYVLHVDLSPIRELISLQRRCSNNINQIAANANKTGEVEQQEIEALKQDYKALWEPLSELLIQLAEIVKM